MDSIIEHSGKEDLSPLLKRLFNWHFYDAYRNDEASAMGRYFTGARKSLHHIFNERADILVDSLENGRASQSYEFTGRLLHYIQDMTVPAHVAPIFHYKFVWFDQGDYFDEMPEWRTSPYTPTAATCNFTNIEITELKSQLERLLNETALSTRDRIREMIPTQADHPLSGQTWEAFWVLRRPEDDEKYQDTIKGFAPYGEQGREGFERLCQDSTGGREACLEFFTRSYESAIASTVETLLLVNSVVRGE